MYKLEVHKAYNDEKNVRTYVPSGLVRILKPRVLQGLPSGFDLMYLALADRNKQVRFGLKVVLES